MPLRMPMLRRKFPPSGLLRFRLSTPMFGIAIQFMAVVPIGLSLSCAFPPLWIASWELGSACGALSRAVCGSSRIPESVEFCWRLVLVSATIWVGRPGTWNSPSTESLPLLQIGTPRSVVDHSQRELICMAVHTDSPFPASTANIVDIANNCTAKPGRAIPVSEFGIGMGGHHCSVSPYSWRNTFHLSALRDNAGFRPPTLLSFDGVPSECFCGMCPVVIDINVLRVL